MDKVCVFCKKDQQEVPLMHVEFKNKEFWICPQHIPILIHDPSKLVGHLDDADAIQAG